VANEAVALIALPLLVSLNQWMFTRTVARVDPHLIPVVSRRRVQWLVAHSARIYAASALLIMGGLVLQAGLLLR
jgi:hypothetical protein